MVSSQPLAIVALSTGTDPQPTPSYRVLPSYPLWTGQHKCNGLLTATCAGRVTEFFLFCFFLIRELLDFCFQTLSLFSARRDTLTRTTIKRTSARRRHRSSRRSLRCAARPKSTTMSCCRGQSSFIFLFFLLCVCVCVCVCVCLCV